MKLHKLGLGKRLNSLFKGKRDGEEILSDIEELLITSDFDETGYVQHDYQAA